MFKKVFRINRLYTDSINSDKHGFGYFVETTFENKFLSILTLGWRNASREFTTLDEARAILQQLERKAKR